MINRAVVSACMHLADSSENDARVHALEERVIKKGLLAILCG